MQLKGKVIDFLGDSITEGVGVADQNNRYDNVLKRIADLKAVHNYGVSGTRIAHQNIPSPVPRNDLCMCGRAYDLERSADIIVVYGGVNDYLHGDAPIGDPADTTPQSFWGGVRFLMNFLKTEYAGKQVIFMTPAHCHLENVYKLSPKERRNGKDIPLIEYVNIIKTVGAEYGIPVLDLYHLLGIDPNHEEEKLQYTADGLHFNDEGHAVLAQKLHDFLKAL